MNKDRPSLAVFHNLPSGGGIRVVQTMLPALVEEFDVTLHYLEGSAVPEGSSQLDAIEWPFPRGRRIRGIGRILAPLYLSLRLSSLVRKCREIAASINDSADLALVHNSMFVAAPPLLEYLRVPSLYFCYEYPRHIYEPEDVRRTEGPLGRLLLSGLRRQERRIDLRAAEAADRMITLSSWMQGRIKEIYGIDPGVVRPGIDTDLFEPCDNEGRSGVLSVGALWPYKGHDLAIESISMIEPDSRPTLSIVADREFPGYSDSLMTAASVLGVRLDIRMNISNDALRDLYSSSKAVLCCQRNEPYGLVPLEAMACGTPVIAVNEGGFRDNVRDGINGFLVDRDPGSIVDALKRIETDGELRSRIVRNGIAFVTGERTVGSASETLVGHLRQLLR